MLEQGIERAAAAIVSGRSLVISTGAGMSKESGIPTFRDAMDGLWARFDPGELATEAAFRGNAARVWSWYEHRRRTILRCRPHAGHLAIAELGALIPGLTLVTQNVDGLHRAAGSADVVELHGDIMRSRCIDCSAPAKTPDPGEAEVERSPPRCERCGGFIRPGVVWFGEMLPPEALERAQRSAATCDVMLVIGTSGVVWPAAELPALARRSGATLIEVNPTRSEITPLTDIFLEGSGAVILPHLVATVREMRAGG